tara:strand:+ start:777 stop:1682 length:906 start_codon:yes stop_codon:yes gene_type:complete
MAILVNSEQTYYGTTGDHGSYQFLNLTEAINSFRATYVGKGKICEDVLDQDITFHALRAMQELSFDTLKSVKDWEVTVPPQLVLVMPADYVNYVKLSWSDSSGIEHVLYPTSKSSNPLDITEGVESWGGFTIAGATDDLASDEESETAANFKSATPIQDQDSYDDQAYNGALGQRFGIDPQNAQVNGSFFIDESVGKFHFSSNLNGKTLILRYISDGLVTNRDNNALVLDDILLHKFAEEAFYKHVLYGLLLGRKDTQPHLLAMIKKERFAETRKAKIRLSNIKIEELTQILRGKSKQIKH